LKALTAHPAFERVVDRDALALFLRYNYVPAPHSIWCGVSKLPAGHYVEIRGGARAVATPVPYWDFRRVAAEGAANPLPDTAGLVDDLEVLLKDAVGRQMSADVPLGAFLSGGIDSSLIVALMQSQSERPVRTFTIGFQEADYNEAIHAKSVAEHLGTDHTELYVTAGDALAIVPRLGSIWDEPFSDPSQIPTYLISALTRQHVTVSLSGDGGDELFGGYNRYVSGMQLWNVAQRFPMQLRKVVAAGLAHPACLKAVSSMMGLLPSRHRHLGLADRLPKIGQLFGEASPEGVYRRLVSNVIDPERIVLGGREPSAVSIADAPAFADFRQKMMFIDTVTYLPDDILVKVDRASMAVSLETRVPFLDYRVLEFAWRLPMSTKIRDGIGKHILREVLYRHVPRALVERPKMGFAIPMEQWLAGPLRPWAEDLLDEERLRREGFFDADRVRALWLDHISGRQRLHNQLWSILMFQAWWAEHRHQAATGSSRPRVEAAARHA
jgi:asparagine synthase (glutamine-hydrolysing)